MGQMWAWKKGFLYCSSVDITGQRKTDGVIHPTTPRVHGQMEGIGITYFTCL